MIAEHLTNAVVTALLVLINSGPDEVNRDIAMTAVENIGADLSEMGPADRAEFVELLDRMARDDPAIADFVRNIPHIFGWDRGM